MTIPGLLGQFAAFVGGVILVGAVAHFCQSNEHVLKRIVLGWVAVVAITLAYTVVSGQFLGYAPGSEADDGL